MVGTAEFQVAQTESGCLVRIVGRGTMRESPALETFVLHTLSNDPSVIVKIDLDRCEYLDSTFLGNLVALSQRYSDSPPSRFFIVASEETRSRLLVPMRLDQVLHFAEEPPDSAEWCQLPADPTDPEMMGRHAMECHRRLAELGGPHAAAFDRVADQLASELEGKTR